MGGDISRQKLSETALIPFLSTETSPTGLVSPTGGFPIPAGALGIPVYFTQYETEFILTYDFDIWGKNRKTWKAALNEIQAEYADLAFSRLQLGISVARTYYQLQISYRRQEILIELVENRMKYQDLVRNLVSGNLSDRLTLHNAELELKQAEYQLQVTRDAAGNTVPERHPLIEQQKASIRNAYYNLKHCEILAPSTGYIAQRNVNVGQWVTPTTHLMALIPIDYMWVDANFKETQLTYMRVGQPAKVWFDMYGSKVEYQGHVLGIASGSGSVFSLIPPQNATGNWIKIVQRLPVRISLDPDSHPIFM